MKKCSLCNKVFGIHELIDLNVCPSCGGKLYECDIDNLRANDTKESFYIKYKDEINPKKLYDISSLMFEGKIKRSFDNEWLELLKFSAYKGYNPARVKYASYLLENKIEEESAYSLLKLASKEGSEEAKTILAFVKPKDIIKNSGLTLLDETDEKFEELVKDAMPGILTITSSYSDKGEKVSSIGSGFIIENGYVVTNAHVIGDRDAKVVAHLDNSISDIPLNLSLLKIDYNTDLAILEFSGLGFPKNISYKEFETNEDEVDFGTKVYTIGNPLALGLSVSRGIVSSPVRKTDYPKGVSYVIQTDISFNHGNSGGALLDMNNKVIGICTFMPSESNGGIGMCVPVKYIQILLDKID